MYRAHYQAGLMLAPGVRHFSTSIRYADASLAGNAFSASYEMPRRVRGPLGSAGLSPRSLKRHLDRFVIGQDRAKKVLSVAMYNHYLRTQEIERREQVRHQQRRHAVDQLVQSPFDEALLTAQPADIGQPTVASITATGTAATTVVTSTEPTAPGQPHPTSSPVDSQHVQQHPDASHDQDTAESLPTIEKSNVLLLGPTGVGKTLLAKTLAGALGIPFSISDCTPFTQAGYIGEDADVCVSRLLTAANYDITRAEHGIIVLDEVDKLAARKVTGGRDVSGEGVQQALLKIIEGTTIQIQAKSDKGGGRPTSGPPPSNRHDTFTHTTSPGSPVGLTPGFGGLLPSGPRSDVYNVRTDNILFIFTGAFIGLHKMVLDRVSKGSIGFGAQIRSAPEPGVHDTLITGTSEDIEMFRKNVPFYVPPQPTVTTPTFPPSFSDTQSHDRSTVHYPFPDASLESAHNDLNLLDLVTPPDLQEYGLIPELIGRIPIQASLAPLPMKALLRVLTEPQNSLISQFDALFRLSGIQLRFTRAALEEIASAALALGTGARGLRSIMEGVLSDAMFEAPGSETEYVIVTQEVAKRTSPALFLPGHMSSKVEEIVSGEERKWERDWLIKYGPDRAAEAGIEPVATTLDEYRAREAVGGFA